MKRLKWLISTRLGWLITCLVLFGVSLISSDYFGIDWLYYVSYLFIIYPLVLLMILISYAFIINPYNDYKERKKKQKELSGN